MPSTPNPLIEMGRLNSVVVSKDERPNPSFEDSALLGFKNTVQSRRAIRIFDGVPIIDRKYPLDAVADAFRYVETAQKTGIVVINVIGI